MGKLQLFRAHDFTFDRYLEIYEVVLRRNTETL